MTTSYDKTDIDSIEEYARQLIGKTFREAVNAGLDNDSLDGSKGRLGNLIEENYFGYDINSRQLPDFEEVGVELKVTPYKVSSKGEKVAKERLVITMINYMDIIDETFVNSHLWLKLRLMLIIYYLYEKGKNRLDYRIDYVSLFRPPEEDLRIIKDDYEKIVAKIRSGHAHELSEADTLYLSACTKSNNSNTRVSQPNSDIPAKPRAFALKSSYMTYALNNYIIPDSSVYDKVKTQSSSSTESIIPFDKAANLEDYVYGEIMKYRGCSVAELSDKFKIPKESTAKNRESLIALRMLGVKSNAAEEFIKAGIKVKTIRVNNNNTIREHMSFPAMKFKTIANEDWEDDYFYKILTETKFFFVVYKEDKYGEMRLQGCKFWNMPARDIAEVQKVWGHTKNLINGLLVIKEINGRKINNLPKPSENRVSHVRPHGRNADDVDILPDGRTLTKQCFWLNNSYILSQIKDLL